MHAQSILVICLEGSHGCGKSELISILKAEGYNTLDEGFLDMPHYTLHPQSFVMESIWAQRWIERLLDIQKKHSGDTQRIVYFADRSPFSVMFYAPNGKILEPMLMEQRMELLGAGIEIITVHISVTADVLWDRITSRIYREPERINYNEGSHEHMRKAINFYANTPIWDYTIDNSTNSTCPAFENILEIVEGH